MSVRTNVVMSAVAGGRPARPTRWMYDAGFRGTDVSITAERSPMSMPISSVGVAVITFGASGAGALLKASLERLALLAREQSGVLGGDHPADDRPGGRGGGSSSRR